MYIYNYFIILLDVCVSYDTRFDTIHNTKKLKINSRYDLRFDNYDYDAIAEVKQSNYKNLTVVRLIK